ncbi:DUF305 domain-containing protein [Streptomyces sp. NPDC005805]|uniref:DUF305 domain-containing protein n=1 Tax=Streptomyces sp. NPDC005805 TaxID=3157068 RepID=UPI0033F8C7D9
MTTYRPTIRRASARAAAATACALVLAACGGQDAPAGHNGHDAPAATSSAPASASPSASGRHNAADVAFAQGMIPHHRQAVVMADLAGTRAGSPEVKALAVEIRKAQGPEIKTLTGWLTAWGEQVPAEDANGHTGHGASGAHGAAGMMTPEELAGLEKATGKAFDTAFLELMVEHHEGAVAMARTERSDGAHGPAIAMARDIIASQSAEIARMNALLGRN